MKTQAAHRTNSTKSLAPETPRQRSGVASLPRMERVLVPVDFSESATDALRFALPFARETGARLDLLHVLKPVTNGGLGGAWGASAANEHRRRDASKRLQQLAATETLPPIRTGVRVMEGPPAAVIARIAQKQRSDLVVISRHGHSGLQRFFVGSTAERVLRHAPWPVLVVRQPKGARQKSPTRQPTATAVPATPLPL